MSHFSASVLRNQIKEVEAEMALTRGVVVIDSVAFRDLKRRRDQLARELLALAKEAK